MRTQVLSTFVEALGFVYCSQLHIPLVAAVAARVCMDSPSTIGIFHHDFSKLNLFFLRISSGSLHEACMKSDVGIRLICTLRAANHSANGNAHHPPGSGFHLATSGSKQPLIFHRRF